jgi:hypothetical protein
MSLVHSRADRVLAAAVLMALATASADAGEFVPHRAVYALSKGSPRGGLTVADVSGSMVIEVDEACDGWSLSQRIKMTVTDNMGGDVESDSRYASFETKDGTQLRFQASDWQNGQLVEETSGTAERPAIDQPGNVTFVKPGGETFELPPHTVFPVAFNLDLVRKMNVEGFHSMPGFDGGNLEGAYTITVFIGKERDSELKDGAELGNGGALLGGIVRNVRVAYFPIASKTPEPELEYDMELQPNGVSPMMRLDYQRYQVRAKLIEVEALPRPKCGS